MGPATGTWTETGPLNEARDLTDPVLLQTAGCWSLAGALRDSA